MNVASEPHSRPITIVLPWYLHSGFRDLFQHIGFRVLWAESREELEGMLRGEAIDLALEWRHGREDYPVRDLLRSLGLDVPILLYLDWDGKLPGDPAELGYAGWISTAADLSATLRVFYMVIPEDRRPALARIMEYVNAGKSGRRSAP